MKRNEYDVAVIGAGAAGLAAAAVTAKAAVSSDVAILNAVLTLVPVFILFFSFHKLVLIAYKKAIP